MSATSFGTYEFIPKFPSLALIARVSHTAIGKVTARALGQNSLAGLQLCESGEAQQEVVRPPSTFLHLCSVANATLLVRGVINDNTPNTACSWHGRKGSTSVAITTTGNWFSLDSQWICPNAYCHNFCFICFYKIQYCYESRGFYFRGPW